MDGNQTLGEKICMESGDAPVQFDAQIMCVCGMVKLLYSGSYRTAAVNSAFSKFHFVA
jgi:hypothetical protein